MPNNKEIERRFVILSHDSEFLKTLDEGMSFHQGIIRGDENHTLRVRIITEGEDERALLTYKTGKGIERDEEEEDLNLPAAQLLLKTSLHSLHKTRHNLDDGGELDIFKDVYTGLMIIEYEFHGAMRDVVQPDWIHAWVEVTGVLTSAALSESAPVFKTRNVTPETVTQEVLSYFIHKSNSHS